MGKWVFLSKQHSFEGSGIRKQLTICCQAGGNHPQTRVLLLCAFDVYLRSVQTAPVHQLCSQLLLLLLHSRSLLVTSAPTCPLFNYAITSDEDIFYLTSRFLPRWQKEKQSHTLSSKQRTKNVTLNNLPLVKDNHKDEQNHQTE